MLQKNDQHILFGKLSFLISSSLKGFSQVLLIGNAFSGFLILIGISIFSPILGLVAFSSSFIGTIIGILCDGERALIKNGIYSFNAVLCGITPMLFLSGYHHWMMSLCAAALSAFAMKLLSKISNRVNIPVLTIPFVFITWIGLLIAYRIETLKMDPNFVISSPSTWNMWAGEPPTLLIGMIKGIGEVFLIDSLWTGSLILIALFLAGWRFGVYAIIGAFVSWLTAFFIGADAISLNLGLYNYNAVLTIIAVGLVFNKKSKNSLLTGVLAAMVTVPVTAGLELLLNPIGLPALTAPFIVCTWFFLALRTFFPKL